MNESVLHKHTYTNEYFDYVESGTLHSAKAICQLLVSVLQPKSLLDVGCGRGAWLTLWHAAGVDDFYGVDGEYVDLSQLKIPAARFLRHNLSYPLDIGRRFELVQSLEVAEHLPSTASAGFVETLTRHGDIVLFSAAVVGQGGENHINERPLEFWRNLFSQRGFAAFDYVRPEVAGRSEVGPWYRFNTILYANSNGQERLPKVVLNSRVPSNEVLRDGGDMLWKLRRSIVRAMPRSVVDWIAKSRSAHFSRTQKR